MDDLSNVLPFRKPGEDPGEVTRDSAVAAEHLPREELTVTDPLLQSELDRLTESLSELDNAVEPEGLAGASVRAEPGTAAAVSPPTAMAAVRVHFGPHELQRRGRIARWTAEDDACVATESAFRGRFGFGCNRCRRFQLLCLLHEDDLTDRELRLLWRARDIAFNDAGAYNSAPRSLEIVGHVWVGFMGLLLTLAFVRLLRLPDPLPPPSALGLFVLVVCGLLGLIWCANTFYIFPSQIRRRAQHARARAHG